MSPSVDGETLDGFSNVTINRIIEDMRSCEFQFRPCRKEEIPKSSGGTRGISVAPPQDKVVQQVMLFILESIYDSQETPYFLDCSHGFRYGRSPHTALEEIKETWTGTHWFIEGDVKSCFDRIDKKILDRILRKKIQDERFLNLIQKILNAGYYQFGHKYNSLIGVPQGTILSPILSNIYLTELDQFVMDLCDEHCVGKKRKTNPEYNRIAHNIRRLLKQGYRYSDRCVKDLAQKKSSIPSVDVHDPNYTRTRYVRFADDFIIGITGSKELAIQIREQVTAFMQRELALEMNLEKTHITHAKEEHAKFLGVWLTTGKTNGLPRRVKVANANFSKVIPKRTGKQTICLKIPTIDILKRLEERDYLRKTSDCYKAKHVGYLLSFSDQDIVKHYNAVWRGIRNYYSCCDHITPLNTIKHLLKASCVLTLSGKHRRSAKQTYTKHGNNIQVIYSIPETGKIKQIEFDNTTGVGQQFQYRKEIDRINEWINMRSRSATGLACKICGSTEKVEMHHVRHIRKMNQKLKGFHKVMASLNRKQVPVCKECHLKIHRGEYDSISLKDLAY